MTHKEHFDKKRLKCPCLNEVYKGSMHSIRRGVDYECHATGGDCELSGCPFFYWVSFVNK